MRLNLTLNGEIIATAPIDPSEFHNEKYLKILCRILTLKNKRVIKALKKKPSFYIEVSSRMNNPSLN
ncbi:MAG: hypothetical protein EON98_07390 [Chitinophagaceae bacterium]|nr:MAG: hypothetical protein EON98_07390 [Chitinophagaceae bacterium]